MFAPVSWGECGSRHWSACDVPGATISTVRQESTEEYLRGWTDLARLFHAGQVDEALGTVLGMIERFPDRSAALGHAQACLLASGGRGDEALRVMSRLVYEGRWWSQRQLSDPYLKQLASCPEYDSLAAAMRRGADRAIAEAASASAELEVLRPAGRPRCTVVALHMATVSGRETARIWEGVTGSGIAVVSVESTLHNGDGQPSWDDADLAERDVRAGLAQAGEIGGPIILAGGSQGAGVAARLALAGVAPELVGYLCVVGAPSPGSWTPRASVPGLLVVGGADPLTAEAQRTFSRQASGHGLRVELIEVPGLGHRYPDGWGGLAPPLIDRWIA